MNIAAGPPPSGRGRGCLKLMGFGCAGFLVFLILASIVFSIFYRELTSWKVNSRTEKYLEQSAMSDENKTALKAQIQRMMDAYVGEELSDEDMQAFAHSLQGEAIYPGFLTIILVADVAPRIGFNEEQLISLEKSFSRLTKGMQAYGIKGERVTELIQPIINKEDFGSGFIRPDIEMQELLDVQSAVDACTDEYKVPNELFTYDFNTELEKIINKALASSEREL